MCQAPGLFELPSGERDVRPSGVGELGVRSADEVERAVTDALTWSYTAYYHSAVVLSGETVR